ncbi:MAG: hypothetical protein HYU44_04615 [Betaproteobacteria bacterium]|nr:hypothetical protein [Betaproteobacteria bacterium]
MNGEVPFAGYRLRAPMSVYKMTCDAATGTVIYRSKMRAGLKRNFQVMRGTKGGNRV